MTHKLIEQSPLRVVWERKSQLRILAVVLFALGMMMTLGGIVLSIQTRAPVSNRIAAVLVPQLLFDGMGILCWFLARDERWTADLKARTLTCESPAAVIYEAGEIASPEAIVSDGGDSITTFVVFVNLRGIQTRVANMVSEEKAKAVKTALEAIIYNHG